MKPLFLRSVHGHKPICILRNCTATRLTRGLCRQHYDRARRIVLRGLDTWENLVRRGHALPKRKFRRGHLKKEYLRGAIVAIHERGEYPSGARINRELGRRTRSLCGDECELRRQIFGELGIEVSMRGGCLAFGRPFNELTKKAAA